MEVLPEMKYAIVMVSKGKKDLDFQSNSLLMEIKIHKNKLCARNLCPGRGGAAGGTRKRENAKTPSMETGKNENAKTAKTRKRRKHNPFRSTLNTNVITDLGMCRYVRQQSIPYTSNTNFITALGMCKVCTEAAQSVAL